ncbi:MAG: hypothetical protein ACRDL2_05915 [Gaiellaceae bacterium]
MGWQDRDWAKLNEDELQQLYRIPVRRGVSPLVSAIAGIAMACTLAFAAYTQRPSRPHIPSTPAILYGERATFGDGEGGGDPMACTDELIVNDSWHCREWSVDTTNAPIVEPKAYVGQCTHVRADQELGRWVCLGETPPAPTPSGDA